MTWFGSSGVAGALAAVAVVLAVSPAGAHVKREGTWPDADRAVTLDVDGLPRRDALRKLADAAGWSVVVHAPPGDPVDVHVKAQPAAKVLEILLDDGDYVATRDGTLISIERAPAAGDPVPPAPPAPSVPAAPPPPAPPAPPSPASPPSAAAAPAPPAPPSPSEGVKLELGKTSQLTEPHRRGSDKTVMGGDLTLGKGERLRDLSVFGGNVDIEGEVSGDVTIWGGSVRVHEGGRVHGDATVFGGKLQLDRAARVDGDVSCVGGDIQRDPGSIIGGEVSVKGGRDSRVEDAGAHRDRHAGLFVRAADSIVDGVRIAAVLFVIGTVLIALLGRRMDQLRLEVATRPMRSLALGLLGTLVSVVLLVALCVTLVGAPVAAVAFIVGGFMVLGAMCAVLSVVGEALLRHKTENPYVHLAVGCALFVALSALPYVGGFVIVAVLLSGVGILVATRGAGFFVKRNGNGGGGQAHYRSSAGLPTV